MVHFEMEGTKTLSRNKLKVQQGRKLSIFIYRVDQFPIIISSYVSALSSSERMLDVKKKTFEMDQTH